MPFKTAPTHATPKLCLHSAQATIKTFFRALLESGTDKIAKLINDTLLNKSLMQWRSPIGAVVWSPSTSTEGLVVSFPAPITVALNLPCPKDPGGPVSAGL